MTKRKDPLDLRRLTLDRWMEIYQPVVNHLDPHKSGEQNGLPYDAMFETYGPEVEFVGDQPDEFVWTLVDCDGKLYISDGWHFVNRMGYFVCKVARRPDADFCILY